jgi:hypothetical protein
MAWNIPAMLPWHCDNIPGHPASHRGDTEVTQPSKRGEGEHHRITSVTIAACRYLLAPPTIITKSGQPLRRPPQKASRAIETMALRPPRPAPCRPLSSSSYAWAPLVRIVPYTDCRPRPMSTTSTTRTTTTATTTTTSAALTDWGCRCLLAPPAAFRPPLLVPPQKRVPRFAAPRSGRGDARYESLFYRRGGSGPHRFTGAWIIYIFWKLV